MITMTELQPDLSFYYAIHRGQRRDTARYVEALQSLQVKDHVRRRALSKWAIGFGHELVAHHTIEDTVVFPDLARRVPATQAILDRLEGDHVRVHHLLEELNSTARGLVGLGFVEARERAIAVAIELRDLLQVHLDVEDEQILTVFAEQYSVEEYEALDAKCIKALPKKGIAFSVPWTISNFDEQTRAELLPTAPMPLRAIYRLTHRRYERLVEEAFGEVPAPV